LLDSLISAAKPSQSGGLAKQALSSIAQCVAVLCLAAGDQKCASTIEMLKVILKDDSPANSVSFFSWPQMSSGHRLYTFRSLSYLRPLPLVIHGN
jgi:hypothetical protein